MEEPIFPGDRSGRSFESWDNWEAAVLTCTSPPLPHLVPPWRSPNPCIYSLWVGPGLKGPARGFLLCSSLPKNPSDEDLLKLLLIRELLAWMVDQMELCRLRWEIGSFGHLGYWLQALALESDVGSDLHPNTGWQITYTLWNLAFLWKSGLFKPLHRIWWGFDKIMLGKGWEQHLQNIKSGFPGGSDGKASARNVGDQGSIPGLGRSPGKGSGNPLQYSCLENSMGGGAWWAIQSMGSQRVGHNWATSLSMLMLVPLSLLPQFPPGEMLLSPALPTQNHTILSFPSVPLCHGKFSVMKPLELEERCPSL